MDRWQVEYAHMKARLKAFGESDADADTDAQQWADMVVWTQTHNDTTQDDECNS